MSRSQLDYLHELASVPFDGRSPNAFETTLRASLYKSANTCGPIAEIPARELIFASECLGALATWGARSPNNWRSQLRSGEIRSKGFAVLAKGELGIAEFLGDLATKTKAELTDTWNPTESKRRIAPVFLSTILGVVRHAISRFAKLEAESSGPGRTWFISVLARCATDLQILEPGTSLYGHPPIETPYLTIVQAAKALGISTVGLRASLTEFGVVDSAHDPWVSDAVWVDIKKHRSLLVHLADTHTVAEAAQYVGTDAVLITQLYHAGKIQPFVVHADAEGTRQLRFATCELDGLLKRLTGGTMNVADQPSDKRQSLVARAAMQLGCTRKQIIEMLILHCFENSQLSEAQSTETGTQSTGAATGPNQVRHSKIAVGLRDAARKLLISPEAMKPILEMLRLPITASVNPVNGRSQFGIGLEILQDFVLKYVSLSALAAHLEVSPADVRKMLAAAGVYPAIAVYSRLYDRSHFVETEFEHLATVGLDVPLPKMGKKRAEGAKRQTGK